MLLKGSEGRGLTLVNLLSSTDIMPPVMTSTLRSESDLDPDKCINPKRAIQFYDKPFDTFTEQYVQMTCLWL